MNQEQDINAVLPRVILHNTISLDGSIKGFQVDINMHYSIASSLKVDAYLIGSKTILDASDEIPPEKGIENNKKHYEADDIRPFWVVVDSQSRLKGILHFYRQMEYIKDIIVLVSHNTPKDYIHYLKERNYPYIQTGHDKVDLFEGLRQLKKQYQIETILTDTGSTLNNLLLQKKLADEISVIIAPFIVPKSQPKIFIGLDMEEKQIKLESRDNQTLGNDYVWLRYKIIK
jgi:2,5-diamino-6-(ribosylamino)-4(3H)-pyrimidinone 5'-phosphate reductase